MEKFITLNHLKKAVDALLLKIDNDKQYYVEKTSVETAFNEGYLIGSVGGIDLYAPSSLLTRDDLNDIYDYIDAKPAATITKANITAWNNKADTNTTYSLSISGNRITLTPSSGDATYIDLPVYDGGVI